MDRNMLCFMEDLSSNTLRALKILSLATLLDDRLAAIVLWRLGITRAPKVVAQIKEIPVWHKRTDKTWVIDNDVRECLTIDMLYSEKEKIYEGIYAGLIGHMKREDKGIDFIFTDYFMNSVRVALRIRSRKMWAIGKIGEMMKSDDPEIKRVCLLYLEEAGINFNERRSAQ